MPIFDVIVPPDDFSVVVDEDTEYADYFDTLTLVDEDGDELVDEDGDTLVVTQVATGAVYVVYVPPDDFSVVVDEE